ncbi:hypothetical protein DNK56_08175 [Streptomyces sp. AC1-42W]|nr:hypothetical protein DNK55_23270 [Streptomyces sp. AC1-42T]PZT82060.1 hypothetical protein DNK56_08175 [Streptomyces sp. AC1-42W]
MHDLRAADKAERSSEDSVAADGPAPCRAKHEDLVHEIAGSDYAHRMTVPRPTAEVTTSPPCSCSYRTARPRSAPARRVHVGRQRIRGQVLAPGELGALPLAAPAPVPAPTSSPNPGTPSAWTWSTTTGREDCARLRAGCP